MKSFVIMRNVLRRIVHDVRTLALIIVMPLFFILLYGNAFSGNFRNLSIIIVNQDNGLASVRTEKIGRITLPVNLADVFIAGLDRDMFHIRTSDDPQAAEAAVAEPDVWAALVFPKDFSHAVVNEALRQGGKRVVEYEGKSVTLVPSETAEAPSTAVIVDDSNPLVTKAILEAFNEAFSGVLATQQAALTPKGILDIRLLYGGKIRMLDFTAPGIIGFAMTLITVVLTALSIVRERTSGTLTRILIAPIRAWEVAAGYTLAFSVVALLQAAELFLASALLFNIRFVGNPGLVTLIIVLFTITLQGIATLISTVSRSEAQAMQLVLLLLIPSIMISGVFWPLETTPAAIRPLSYLSPLTYANSALRKVMLTGYGLGEITFEIAVLGAFAVAMLLLGVLSMRRQAYTA